MYYEKTIVKIIKKLAAVDLCIIPQYVFVIVAMTHLRLFHGFFYLLFSFYYELLPHPHFFHSQFTLCSDKNKVKKKVIMFEVD